MRFKTSKPSSPGNISIENDHVVVAGDRPLDARRSRMLSSNLEAEWREIFANERAEFASSSMISTRVGRGACTEAANVSSRPQITCRQAAAPQL